MKPAPLGRRLDAGETSFAVGEALLAVLVLFAIDSLAHARLTAKAFVAGAVAWTVAALLTTLITRGRWQRGRVIVALLLGGFSLAIANAILSLGLSVYQCAYVAGFTALLGAWGRRWIEATDSSAKGKRGETLRLAVLGAVAFWLSLSMFSDRLVGGTDARWYAYMLADFFEQLRAGVFPVFVGQTEYAFNGAVHPFRTAPFFVYWAALWDALTFRSLSILALQHLTVIASTFVGAIGMYVALVRLAPARRWAAAAIAVLYVSSPAFIAVIHAVEAYMSFMTVGVLPLFIYGQLKTLESEGKTGWASLAAGLALVWFCHAGIAAYCTFATILIQGGRFMFAPPSWEQWKRAAGAAVLFVLFSAVYFVSMAELPNLMEASRGKLALQLLGAAATLAGVVHGPIGMRRWGWLVLALGGGMLWLSNPAWLCVCAIACVLIWVFAAVARWKKIFDPRDHAWSLLMEGLLAAVLILPNRWAVNFPDRLEPALFQLRIYEHKAVASFFSPFVRDVAEYQPGFGIVVLAFVILGVALITRSTIVRLFVPPIVLLAISCRPVPGVSEFWVAYFPKALAEVTSFPLDYRLLPVFAALVCGAGFWWMTAVAERRPKAYSAICVTLFLLGAWGTFQAKTYVQRSWAGMSARTHSERQFRSENVLLERFVYDHLQIPAYFSNGATDVRLESRVFTRDGNKRVVGPDEIARRMEESHRDEKNLVGAVDSTAPAWLTLSPELQLAPGEHLLLRFEFLPQPYAGWLIFKSENIYREYHLPESGAWNAFGVGAAHSKTISLWNSGKTDEHVALSFKRDEPLANSVAPGEFAKLVTSHFRAEQSPVRLESLIPYRARVELREAGWLETPRVFLPGYTVTVDGRRVSATPSSQGLLQVPLDSGSHLVEVRFAGSWKLWLALWISALSWIGFVWWAFVRKRQRDLINTAAPVT